MVDRLTPYYFKYRFINQSPKLGILHPTSKIVARLVPTRWSYSQGSHIPYPKNSCKRPILKILEPIVASLLVPLGML